jgi:two-component system response regulator HydG
MSSLLIIKGQELGKRIPLKDINNVGREPQCEIYLADPLISRLHCQIIREQKAFRVRDCQSTNGVFVNGKRVSEKILVKNDEITVGNTTFIYDSDYELKNVSFGEQKIFITPLQDETISLSLSDAPSTADAKIDVSLAESLQLLDQLSSLCLTLDEDFPESLRPLLQQLTRLFSAPQGFLMLWDPVLQELQPLVASGETPVIPAQKSIINSVFLQRRLFIAQEVEQEWRLLPDYDPALRRTSIIAAPLAVKDKALGLLYLLRSSQNPFSLKELFLLQSLGRLLAVLLEHQQRWQRTSLSSDAPHVIYRSSIMESLLSTLQRIAPHYRIVLLKGETGTGKELLARYLHYLSPRREHPFVALNCAAIPDTLFESELFGYERGAFTGADRLKRGALEIAHGGTILLDEVSELSLSLQPKLLRFLQEQTFYRLGGTQPVKVDVNIIAATNVALDERVQQGKFRADLLYRLKVLELVIPPLRKRREDIRPLTEAFLARFSAELHKPILGISEQAMSMLERYPWPGNVRELQNCLERAVLLCSGGPLKPEHLSPSLLPGRVTVIETPVDQKIPALADLEKQHILHVLELCKWNQVKASSLLGIHRNTLRQKIKLYDLHPL